MDVDDFAKTYKAQAKQYQSDLAPPAPTIAPNTSLHRAVPIRAPAVGSDVGVPFLLALASAIVTFASVGIVALALSWSIGVPGVAAGVVLAAVWFWRLKNWESLLWATERITGVDINRDGEIGEPDTKENRDWAVTLVDARSNQKRLLFKSTDERRHAIKAARLIVNGTPFSENSLTGTGRPLSRNEFQKMRDQLFLHDYAYWKDPEHHTLGVMFTEQGEQAVRALASLPLAGEESTDARIRTPRGTKSLPAQSSRGAGEEWDE